MLVIGVVGGIASGKSTISDLLRRQGAVVLDADKTGHMVLQEPDVIRELQSRWGDEVLTSSGQIDRPAVAKIVFAESPQAEQELTFLESVTHPRIGERLGQQIQDLRSDAVPAVVLDAPVLVKAGWNRLCDVILYVDAPPEIRWRRAEKRGWTKKQFENRETSQASLQIKQQLADHVISNTGSLADTSTTVQQLWRSLVGDPSPPQ